MTTVKLANTLEMLTKETSAKHMLDTLCSMEAAERLKRFQRGFSIALSHPTEFFIAMEEAVQKQLATAKKLK